MADIVDMASEHDFNDEMVNHQRSKKKVMAPRGTCLFCGEKVAFDQIFCPTEFGCKEDHEKRQAIIANQTGRK